MKLAFIENPLDHSKLSNPMGVSTFIIQSLRNCGAIVIPIKAEPIPFLINFYKLKEKVLKLFGIRYKYSRDPKVLSMISESIEDRVNSLDVDALISFGTLSMAFLDTDKPKFIWTDAVFDNLLDYHEEYMHLSKKSIQNARNIEAKAFYKAKAIFFCSTFPIQAIEKYKVDKTKLHIATFGANHFVENTNDVINTIIDSKPLDEIRLLFIGYKWEDKGADKTIEVFNELKKRGYHVELDFVGTDNKYHINDSNINFHGKLNKLNEDDYNKLQSLLIKATFLMLLSKYETFGHVICEANSFGLPAITSTRGGLNEVVINNVNGMKFEDPNDISKIAEYIIETFSDRKKYYDLCRSSYRESQERLNWNVGGKKVFDTISKIIRPDM